MSAKMQTSTKVGSNVGWQNKLRKASITPDQLARLKGGPKTNIFVGPVGDMFIGVEGAYVNLLRHYSGFAREQLFEGCPLSVTNGSKNIVQWIYRYMLAGEATNLDDFDIPALIDVYNHGVVLDYQALMDRVVSRLRYMFQWKSLPNVQSLQKISTFIPSLNSYLAKLIADVFMNFPDFPYLPAYVEFAKTDAGFGAALEQALQKIPPAFPKAQSQPTEDTKPADEPAAKPKRKQLTHAQKNAKRREKARQSQTGQPEDGSGDAKPISTEAQNDVSKASNPKAKAGRPKRRAGKGKDQAVDGEAQAAAAPTANTKTLVNKINELTKTVPKRAPPTCYNCNVLGHLARNCSAPIASRAPLADKTNNLPTSAPITTSKPHPRPLPICYTCNTPGHLARNCRAPTEPRAPLTTDTSRPPPTCYACNTPGHLARNCPSPIDSVHADAAPTERRASPTGRNKNYRRAKRERDAAEFLVPIAISGNGEGLRTCDREVRVGEVTRTGLVV
ncbi:hypothetical protein BDV95DRAFT_591099 [Massariosphaeria phaeospora]|uniref:CCHC-type domain-containing protein n=1 Tax=Massariosphaeria phaeospora TaxID=100035 RepID=A0A7C8MDK7_9PLEO|nr:hypothetical protein BDV95DRAFT_591099 [Massariosphaeria phaeospora]